MPVYAALIYTEDLDWSAPEQAETSKQYAEFGEDAGDHIRGGAALYPTATATTVRVQGGRGGEVVTSDGPYAETKEVLGGFYLLECADLDEAIAVAAKIPSAWNGAVEVRPVDPDVSRPADPLAEVVRVEGSRILAVLARSLGDLALAEDALQDAAVSAVEVWGRTGTPDDPAAWLYVAARRKALDMLRRETDRPRRERDAVALAGQLDPELPAAAVVQDDLLRLLFTCCHPSLELDTRVALALRTLCGLSTAEVARVMLVGESAMSKRLTRARQKIGVARIPFQVPGHDELPGRVAGVAAVIHLVYTAGHAGSGSELVRADLCDEAIRLGRLLVELLPEQVLGQGLLALLLLTDAAASGPARRAGGARAARRPGPGPVGPGHDRGRPSACSTGRWWPPTASPTRTSSRRPSRPATTVRRPSRPRTGQRSPGSTASSPPSTPTRWSTSTRRSRSRTPTDPPPDSTRWTRWPRPPAATPGSPRAASCSNRPAGTARPRTPSALRRPSRRAAPSSATSRGALPQQGARGSRGGRPGR